MGWFSANVSAGASKTDSDSSTYGTRTPNISSQYQGAYNNYTGQVGATGANAVQQTGIDWINGRLQGGGAVRPAVSTANTNLRNISGQYGTIAGRTAPQLGTYTPTQASTGQAFTGETSTGQAYNGQAYNGQAFTAADVGDVAASTSANAPMVRGTMADAVGDVTAERSANVDPITGQIGADYMSRYLDPYLSDVVDTSLADYDTGAAEGYNALRAGSASAFGNKRTGVAEGQFTADAARGRGSLAAGLRSQAFNTAAGYGMNDAERVQAADTQTKANLLSNNQFNAGIGTNTAISNADRESARRDANANRTQSADTTNAGNLLSNNQFNANLLTTNATNNANRTQQNTQFNAGQNQNSSQFNAGQNQNNSQFNAGQNQNNSQFNAGQTQQSSQFNAGQQQNNSQFNAGQTQQNDQFNTNNQQQRDMFDIESEFTNTQQQMQALAAQTGINQQILDNVVTQDGIDTQMANALFAAGSITQSQLETILNMATAWNGSSFTQNTDTNTNSAYLNSQVGFK